MVNLNINGREVRDILISMLVIAGVFAFSFSKHDVALMLAILPMTLIAVGFGFVLHELAHRFVAMHFGYFAQYQMWVSGLVLAVVTSFFGFVFAAPGAVYIYGENISIKENGIISIAGPLTNILLAVLFYVGLYIFAPQSYFGLLSHIGFSVNSFLAFFNLIPFGNLDGTKILKWNPILWIATIAIALLLTYGTFY